MPRSSASWRSTPRVRPIFAPKFASPVRFFRSSNNWSQCISWKSKHASYRPLVLHNTGYKYAKKTEWALDYKGDTRPVIKLAGMPDLHSYAPNLRVAAPNGGAVPQPIIRDGVECNTRDLWKLPSFMSSIRPPIRYDTSSAICEEVPADAIGGADDLHRGLALHISDSVSKMGGLDDVWTDPTDGLRTHQPNAPRDPARLIERISGGLETRPPFNTDTWTCGTLVHGSWPGTSRTSLVDLAKANNLEPMEMRRRLCAIANRRGIDPLVLFNQLA